MGKHYNAKKGRAMKTPSWSKVKYQCHSDGEGFLRRDQMKTSSSPIRLVQPVRDVKKASSVLSPLPSCSRASLQQEEMPTHSPPPGLHAEEWCHPLQLQAAALLLRLGNVSLSTIHILTQINHKAIEKMGRNLDLVRKWHVRREEKKIVFGGAARAWRDVGVDEATFDKKTLQPFELSDADAKANKNVRWEQWAGLIQRGCPKTLVLFNLKPPNTVDWKPIALTWLQNRRVVLHSDSARSYRLKVPGVLRDAVAHKKKRVKKGNTHVWVKPSYVKISKHKLPDGRLLKTKSGTQIIDRVWRFICVATSVSLLPPRR
ncbi:unnamed protein product [Effrenium voratum]|uniref:Transposase n=1 Tax=Effrenium voratum TaxID=2562239 RepID=A0AA36HMR3_9DINO|nr:unnamed protein product [Effrenium voratum]